MTDDNFTLPSIDATRAIEALGTNTLIDVRRLEVAEASGQMIAGARHVDPLNLGHDHPVLRSEARLVIYCAKGHEISQFATALALLHKCDAVFVRGGFLALRTAGAPMMPFEAGT